MTMVGQIVRTKEEPEDFHIGDNTHYTVWAKKPTGWMLMGRAQTNRRVDGILLYNLEIPKENIRVLTPQGYTIDWKW